MGMNADMGMGMTPMGKIPADIFTLLHLHYAVDHPVQF